MSIRFKNLVVENFLSIGKASFNFEEKGLVLVEGLNGSGKTSLIVEAPTYALFGITERFGKSRDKVINRFYGKNCHVGLTISEDDVLIEIDAYRKHDIHKDNLFLKINGVHKEGNSNDQTWDKIEKILDMDYTTFINSVVFSQALSQYFSSLSDSSQKDVVEKLLGITWIPKAYSLIKEDSKEVLSEISLNNNNLQQLNIQLSKLNLNLVEYDTKSELFNKEREQKIKNLFNLITEVKDSSQQELEISELDNSMFKTKSVIDELNSEIREIELERSALNFKISDCNIKISEIDQSISKELELGIICDSCGSTISETSIKIHKEHLLKEKRVLEKTLASFSKKEEKLVVVNRQLQFKLTDNSTCLTKISLEQKTKKSLLDNLNLENARIEEKNKSIKKEISDLEQSKNIYRELLLQIKSEITEIKEKVLNLSSKNNELSENLEYIKFWETGFSNSGLKSFIMESVTPQMNFSANLYSSALGGKYNINFSTQKLLKGGDLREKFDVQVMNKVGSDSYSGNSSGERRAIDLITMFVLGDLAASRSNKKVSVLILDDVFEKLDEEICDSVIRVLGTMVSKTGDIPHRESIFVLTHLEYFKSKFINRILTERGDDGNSTYREIRM
jgi:DNA repair exonuclease SbcCD ATPase subunit